MRGITFFSFFFIACMMHGQVDITYQLPPQVMVDIVDAPTTPSISIDPTRRHILFMDVPGNQGIEDLAPEELRIGGIRIDPGTNGPSRGKYFSGLSITDIFGRGKTRIAGLPAGARITNLSWSPDGNYFAFTLTGDRGIELWIGSVGTRSAESYTGPVVNDAFMGRPFTWMPDSRYLIYQRIPESRGVRPVKPRIPAGPVIQENLGRTAAVPTYQDLLGDRYDEEIFEYFTTSQLVELKLDKTSTSLGGPGMYASVDPSPDGTYILVETVRKPFSYLVPYDNFPQTVEVWNREGQVVRLLADLPLADNIPRGFDAATKGPRAFQWRADVPASVYWVEAQDGGDPAVEAEVRDQLFFLDAPFTGQPVESISFNLRFGGITWGNNHLAVARERWQKNRKTRMSFFVPAQDDSGKRLIIERSSEDRYNDPGRFETTRNSQGQTVLLFGNKGRSLFLNGQGASPEGNRPFIDEFDIASCKTKRLWRSEAPFYEESQEFVDPEKGLVITNRQSVDVVPNYFIRNLKNGKLTQITFFEHPYPQFRYVQKELVTYEREDGVGLNFELYLPPGYRKEDGPLPTLLWAYPREYKSADAAGQVTSSPCTFLRISPSSAVIFALRGYAVLNNTAFPVVGEGEDEPNDTFVDQLVANARAAIRKAVELEVTDPKRIVVGGHSYGAFMTANLLVHSDLFAAGIARSGAYNRTLTPFGFQAEPRTYWDAPDIYNNMSPFMHADKLNEPILLIHGMADNNSGTFPIQSERFYAAIKGHGGTARLVMLPYESHGYSARESVLHMLWEMDRWMQTYAKDRE